MTEKHRGKGLATKLMNHAHIWFASNGYNLVQADTQKENLTPVRCMKNLDIKRKKQKKNIIFGYNILLE